MLFGTFLKRLTKRCQSNDSYRLDHFQTPTSVDFLYIRTAVSEHTLSPQSIHRLAHSLCKGISSLHFGRKEHPCWHQQARSVEREEDICAALTRPAFVDLLSSHTLLCRKDGWRVNIYSDCLVLCSGLSPGSCLELRGDQWAWEIYCAVGIRSWFYDLHMLAVLSLTFCLVGEFVERAKSVPGDLLCYGATVLAAHAFHLNRLVRRE